jgi:hypothetical protein
MPKTKAQERREEIKAEFWPKDIAWTGDPPEKGWFRAPRTLPLILTLLSDKKISGKADPGSVYVELLARHRDSGIVEMVSPGEHSYAAGYQGPRGARTWQERMKLLEDLGFIKSSASGNQQYKYVLLVHPTIAVQRLQEAKKISPSWWSTYRARQIEATEAPYEKLMKLQGPAAGATVVPIKSAKAKKSKGSSSAADAAKGD